MIAPASAYALRERVRPAGQGPHPAELQAQLCIPPRIAPYYVAHERAAARTRRVQRERRTATVLATSGIDYDAELAVALVAA